MRRAGLVALRGSRWAAIRAASFGSPSRICRRAPIGSTSRWSKGRSTSGANPIALNGASNTFDFSLSFPSDHRGLVEVTVDAVKGGMIVAQGIGTGNLVPGKVTDVTVGAARRVRCRT